MFFDITLSGICTSDVTELKSLEKPLIYIIIDEKLLPVLVFKNIPLAVVFTENRSGKANQSQ